MCIVPITRNLCCAGKANLKQHIDLPEGQIPECQNNIYKNRAQQIQEFSSTSSCIKDFQGLEFLFSKSRILTRAFLNKPCSIVSTDEMQSSYTCIQTVLVKLQVQYRSRFLINRIFFNLFLQEFNYKMNTVIVPL